MKPEEQQLLADDLVKVINDYVTNHKATLVDILGALRITEAATILTLEQELKCI